MSDATTNSASYRPGGDATAISDIAKKHFDDFTVMF